MKKFKKLPMHSIKNLIIFLIGSLFLVALISQFSTFTNSLRLIRGSNSGLIGAATLCTVLTFGFAAATYCLLALRRLSYVRTVLIQFAAMFVNRLVPAGVGALGINFVYLRRSGHTGVQATAIAGINNLLGLVGNAILVLLVITLYHRTLPQLSTPHLTSFSVLVIVCVVIIGAALLICKPQWRQNLHRTSSQIIDQLGQYRRRPWRIGGALVTSMALTTLNCITLQLSLQSVGGHLPFAAVLLALTVGVGAGAAVPTPGGIGGVEAGIAAALIAYHVPHDKAIAGVIVFRLINYWFTLLLGALAFMFVQRRHYLS